MRNVPPGLQEEKEKETEGFSLSADLSAHAGFAW
jgi:hypothetical protein